MSLLSSTVLRALQFVALSASLFACDATVTGGGEAEDDDAEHGIDFDAEADPDVATSAAHPPVGVWTMSVQYGPVGEAVSPTIPLQVELREDGTAYKWLCAGAPSDGSFTEVCDAPSRSECMVGSFAWTGTRWEFSFPELEEQFIVDEMGPITPGADGDLLFSYINPTYSGALFTRIDEASGGAPSCEP